MTLTITDDNHEPVLVLDENENGLSIVQGDPKMAQTLGLSRFKDLKEIHDYVNDAGQGLQAHFDEASMKGSEQEQQESNPSADDQMAPAIKILKETMARVKQRQEEAKAREEAEKPEAEMLQNDNIQVIQDDSSFIYVSIERDYL